MRILAALLTTLALAAFAQGYPARPIHVPHPPPEPHDLTSPVVRQASVFTAGWLLIRTRSNWVQLAKFCAVGAVGYVVNLAVYTALLHAGLHYLLAATCSFLVAVT